MGCLRVLAGCGEAARYKRFLKHSESTVEKELDLTRFFKRQRINTLAMLALFNARQRSMLHKLSDMVIRESDDEQESDPDNNELLAPDVFDFLSQVPESQN